jgi:hypothetical protein
MYIDSRAIENDTIQYITIYSRNQLNADDE